MQNFTETKTVYKETFCQLAVLGGTRKVGAGGGGGGGDDGAQ